MYVLRILLLLLAGWLLLQARRNRIFYGQQCITFTERDSDGSKLRLRLEYKETASQAWTRIFEKGLENRSFYNVKTNGPSRLRLKSF